MLTRQMFRILLLLVVGAALLLTPAGSATAGEEKPAEKTTASEEVSAGSKKASERKWRMRILGAIAGDNGGVSVTSGGYTWNGVSVSGGGGVGVNFEHRYSPRMGFEFGAMAVGNVSVGAGGDFRRYGSGVEVGGYVPLTFALNYHPLKNSEIVDLFVGPLVASTFVSSVGVGPGVDIGSRVDLGLGANLGVDINFGRTSRWSFFTGLKYISNVTNSGDSDPRLDFDPLIFNFGFGFRF